MWSWMVRTFVLMLTLMSLTLTLEGRQILKENIQAAEVGDWVVALQNKTFTLLILQNKEGPIVTIEEISIPQKKMPKNYSTWRGWLEAGAPGNICWVRYRVDLSKGILLDHYSFTQGGWLLVSQNDSFITKLMDLNFTQVPLHERKRIGIAPAEISPQKDKRPFWQPRLTVEGQVVSGVPFDAFRAQWPADNTELTGKLIEVYVPAQSSDRYPSYFPYWLQVSASVGKAQVHIVDSGKRMRSPLPPLRYGA